MVAIAIKEVSKTKQTEKSRKSKIQIDEDVKQPSVKKDKEKRLYYCQHCGDSFTKQKGNFPTTQSPLFKGNNGYTNMCKKCTDEWFLYFTEVFNGNEEQAMDRMSALFDWYYLDRIMASTRKISADRSRVNAYPSKMNLPQYNPHEDKSPVTYLDTIKDRDSVIISDFEDLKNIESNLSKTTLERFGIGIFNEGQIRILDEHYRLLKKQNPNCDNNQEIFIKDLCYIKLQQLEAMKNGRFDDFDKATKTYRETFKQAGLKTTQEADSSNDEILGVTLATISQYTPEEYYKDKKLYKDSDGLGDYITRFLTRPLKNLQFGSHDRDKEYYVKENEDEN